MSKIVDKLAAAGHLTKEQADTIRATVLQFEKLAAEDPEFHDEALRKLAGPFGVMIPETMKILGATAVAAGGAALAGDLYRTAKNAIMKSRNYKAMLDANPDLRSMDAKQVQRAFNTLSNFNPQYAGDPAVAGDFVKNQVNQIGIDYNRLKNVIDAGHSLGRGPPSPMDYLTNPSTIAGMLQFEHSSPFAKAEQEAERMHQEQKRKKQLHQELMGRAEADRRAAEAYAARQALYNKNVGVP